MSILRELVKIYKANPYRKANGQFASESNADSILKPKEHHSEAVKNTFKNARSKKAKQLLESRAANRKPKTLREEEFLAINGVGRNTIGEAALHRSSNNKSRKTHSKDVERQRQKDMEIINQREKLRKIYQEKLKSGEIKEPTSTEYLSEVAAGDPMLDSTQAAQRVLEKRRLRRLEIEKAKTQKSELAMQVIRKYQGY